MNRYFPLLLIADIAGGVWHFIKPAEGESTMDLCYRFYGRYKNSEPKMRDCIERQLKYGFRP